MTNQQVHTWVKKHKDDPSLHTYLATLIQDGEHICQVIPVSYNTSNSDKNVHNGNTTGYQYLNCATIITITHE
jgi:hypothetical protein